jgi:hypothetical protein
MRFASVLAVLAASLPTMAFAQDVRPPMTPPPAPAPAPVPVQVAQPAPVPQAAPLPEGVDLAQLEDPNIDRSFLLPTAQTQPAGTLSFNDYELILLGLTYGVTNDLQVSVSGLAPIVEDMPVWVTGAAKYRFLKQGRVRMAAQAGFTHLADGDDGDEFDDDDSFTIGHLGVLGSLCMTDDCHSMLTASAQFIQPLSDREDTEGTAVIYSASALIKVSPHVKLMLEVASAGAFTDDENENLDGALVNYGVRFFSGGSIAGDIGFIKPFAFDDEEGDDDDFLLGLPFVNFTYRI